MARYTEEHKNETRERILKAAAREFRSRGYENATIPGIMETAGLTVGGFYKHFDSKAALFVAAFEEAFAKSSERNEQLREVLHGRDYLTAFADNYLTLAHRHNVRGGCVMAALASEMPRAGAEAREAYEALLMPMFDRLADAFGGDRKKAVAFQSLLVGGMVLARGMATDEAAQEILQGCRAAAREMIGG